MVDSFNTNTTLERIGNSIWGRQSDIVQRNPLIGDGMRPEIPKDSWEFMEIGSFIGVYLHDYNKVIKGFIECINYCKDDNFSAPEHMRFTIELSNVIEHKAYGPGSRTINHRNMYRVGNHEITYMSGKLDNIVEIW